MNQQMHIFVVVAAIHPSVLLLYSVVVTAARIPLLLDIVNRLVCPPW